MGYQTIPDEPDTCPTGYFISGREDKGVGCGNVSVAGVAAVALLGLDEVLREQTQKHSLEDILSKPTQKHSQPPSSSRSEAYY